MLSHTMAAMLLLLTATASMAQSAVSAAAVWIDVPFVAQPKEGCGAASLSMVMQYWAAQQHTPPAPASDVDSIQKQIYSPRQHGITAEAMQTYLRQNGFAAYAFRGRWDDLAEEISRGRPLIVALRPSGQTELHYVVIDGVDPGHAIVTMNDPAERKLLTEDRSAFEREWSATQNWTLLAVPQPH